MTAMRSLSYPATLQEAPLGLQMPRGNHPLSNAATLPDQILACLLACPEQYNVHDFKGIMASLKAMGGGAATPQRSSPGSLYKVFLPFPQNSHGGG